MLKTKAPYIFVVAIAFFLFQSNILFNSFPAIYRIYTSIPSTIEMRGQFWTLFWVLSEFVAEIGLIVRYIGACLFVGFSWYLLHKKQFSLSIFRKAILFEGVSFLFYIPFIFNLFTRPVNIYTVEALTPYRLTAISYTIQTILIFSSFIVLYIKTRQPTIEPRLFKWGAIATVGYTFALWVQHFLFNLYALPIDTSNLILLAGLFNSSLTIFVAALLLLITFRAVIRGKTITYNSSVVGISFILVGAYFIVYILVALVNSGYMAFLPLTELWAITFVVLGASFLKEKTRTQNLPVLM